MKVFGLVEKSDQESVLSIWLYHGWDNHKYKTGPPLQKAVSIFYKFHINFSRQ